MLRRHAKTHGEEILLHISCPLYLTALVWRSKHELFRCTPVTVKVPSVSQLSISDSIGSKRLLASARRRTRQAWVNLAIKDTSLCNSIFLLQKLRTSDLFEQLVPTKWWQPVFPCINSLNQLVQEPWLPKVSRREFEYKIVLAYGQISSVIQRPDVACCRKFDGKNKSCVQDKGLGMARLRIDDLM